MLVKALVAEETTPYLHFKKAFFNSALVQETKGLFLLLQSSSCIFHRLKSLSDALVYFGSFLRFVLIHRKVFPR